MSYKIVAVKNSADSVIIGCIFKTQRLGLRSIHVVGEATALFPRSTPVGSFIFREDQQKVNDYKRPVIYTCFIKPDR